MQTYTICPPGPQRPSLFFDPHQFYRRAKAISQTSELSFSDYGRMHLTFVKPMRCARWIPAYATDPKKIARVLMQSAWQYCHGGTPFPEDITMEELRKEVDAKTEQLHTHDWSHLSTFQQDIWHRHRLVFGRPGSGGWFGVHAAIVYRSWNLGHESSKVAPDLFMAPSGTIGCPERFVWVECYRSQIGLRRFSEGEGWRPFKTSATGNTGADGE
jgi:hypothetical protein